MASCLIIAFVPFKQLIKFTWSSKLYDFFLEWADIAEEFILVKEAPIKPKRCLSGGYIPSL